MDAKTNNKTNGVSHDASLEKARATLTIKTGDTMIQAIKAEIAKAASLLAEIKTAAVIARRAGIDDSRMVAEAAATEADIDALCNLLKRAKELS